jgi:hypothetical protein
MRSYLLLEIGYVDDIVSLDQLLGIERVSGSSLIDITEMLLAIQSNVQRQLLMDRSELLDGPESFDLARGRSCFVVKTKNLNLVCIQLGLLCMQK